MPAPTAGDGAARALEEIAIPGILVVLVVGLAHQFYGPSAAGFILIGATILGLVLLASVAKYWNVAYTIGFVAFGLFTLLMIPSVLGELVHPAFDLLGDILIIITLSFIAYHLVSKLGLDSGW